MGGDNMTFTNAQIVESIHALSQAKNETGFLGYAIAVNLRRLNAEAGEYSKKRDELLVEHGTDAGGGKYNFTPETAEAFEQALRPYAELEVEVPVMQVPPEIFYGGGLTSAQMYILGWMVKEE